MGGSSLLIVSSGVEIIQGTYATRDENTLAKRRVNGTTEESGQNFASILALLQWQLEAIEQIEWPYSETTKLQVNDASLGQDSGRLAEVRDYADIGTQHVVGVTATITRQKLFGDAYGYAPWRLGRSGGETSA